MKSLFLIIFIFISSFSFGQDIKSISKAVADINQKKNYKIKTVPLLLFYG
jgi:putative lipase involved disintegration of autophagic bodies